MKKPRTRPKADRLPPTGDEYEQAEADELEHDRQQYEWEKSDAYIARGNLADRFAQKKGKS